MSAIDLRTCAQSILAPLFLFLALAVGFAYPSITFAQTEGACNTATGKIYGPNGTDTEVPCPGTTLSNDGIFGCQGLGAQIQNVGTRAAIGGVYVPVNDAAVTLNTGFLVYKECILDGTARKIAENVSAGYTKTILGAAAEGRNGNAQYLVNWKTDLDPRRTGVIVGGLQDVGRSSMCQAFRGTAQNALARSYARALNEPMRVYTCPFADPSNQQAFLANQRFTYGNWRNSIRPAGNVFGAAGEAQSMIDAALAEDERNIRQALDWGNGVFPRTDNAEDPRAERVLTPGYIIAQSIGQVIGSGFRQLENANEIDQVVANLFGGLTTQLVSDTRGLSGLTQPVNGQPSYLDRMTTQTSASVRQQAANAALGIIAAARQIETSYRQAKEGTATNLSNAILKLRAAEKQCWELIIPKVQERAGQGAQTCTTDAFGQQTCTTTGGNVTLVIATSTQFSQPIIDSQIAPLATSTVNEIRASDASIALLNQLVASVSNSASQANQQQALLRLDTMVANRQLRTTADANNAVQQRDSVATALTKLVDDTIKAWGDSTDPNVGWCNVNNPAVIERWFNAWRQ